MKDNRAEDVEELCRFIHKQYQDAALESGYNGSVPFKQLPESNKQTLKLVAKRLLEEYSIERKEESDKIKRI